jgi:hypothetical protein
MSFNNGAGPAFGLQLAWRMSDRDGHSNRPGPLHDLRLLAEDAQLETKRSNERDPIWSEASEAARARRASYRGPPLASGLK